MAALGPGARLGPYEILALIGSGGMGEVYRARDTRLDREVAIKVLSPHIAADDEFLRRFTQEARASAALEHPNIVAVHDVGSDAARPYIVSELLDGDPLNRRIGGRPIPLDDLLDLAVQIADGLDAAHARGIVHRDLKPANLFVTARGQVKILDFGLARLDADAVGETTGATVTRDPAGRTPTETGNAIGTVPYMSPEQARGEAVDARSDIFSLGLVLYEMVAGVRAFEGATSAVIFDAILNRPVKPLSQANPSVPRELERIVDRCVQKRPEARYQHTRDVLADLRTLKRHRDSAPARSSGSIARAIPTIAVLPFSDMSPEKDQDYFCEGMAEELISALAALPGLHVASRTSSFQFKGRPSDIGEIGAKLRVETVLEGSVRKAGNRLRIAVQLVNASDGFHIWAERYDRDADDVFAVQDEIARAIAQKLKVKLAAEAAPAVRRVTSDPAAYDLYLQGRYYWARRGAFLERAADCFERAIARDPLCAQAHAGLADAYGVLGIYGVLPAAEAASKARPAAERALALEESLAEAHRSLAVLNVSFDWDLRAGEAEYRRALELSPDSGELHAMYAYCLTYQHRFDEARAEVERARALEPESALVAGYNAVNLMFGRRYAEALVECGRCLDLDPAFANAEWTRAILQTRLGHHGAAIASAERAAALAGRRSVFLAGIGMAYAAAGRRDQADAVVGELLARARGEHVSPLWLADIHTQLGDADEAFAWLARAFEARTQALISLGVSPIYDALRGDPRFQTLLARIGVAGLDVTIL